MLLYITVAPRVVSVFANRVVLIRAQAGPHYVHLSGIRALGEIVRHTQTQYHLYIVTYVEIISLYVYIYPNGDFLCSTPYDRMPVHDVYNRYHCAVGELAHSRQIASSCAYRR
jgi:hypothetical protein